MTSRERVLAVMNGQMPDRPPWLEIGFHTDIAGRLIGRELPRSNSGFHPDEDLSRYKEELDGLVETAQMVGLDIIWLKHWDLAVRFQAHLGFSGVQNALGFRNFCLGIYDNPNLVKAILEWYVERNRHFFNMLLI